MRNGVGDPGRRVPFGNLEQSSGLMRKSLCERNICFALLRWLLHPTAADPAPVSSATTAVRASEGRESCAARITVRAVTVLISICAPTSSGMESGNGTTELAGTAASSLQAPDAGKKATLRPCFNPRAGSTWGPTSLTTPAPSNPGTRPPEATVGGVPNAGEPVTP